MKDDAMTRRQLVAAAGAVGATAFLASPTAQAQAPGDQAKAATVFGRKLRYAVVPIAAVRMLNVRTDDQVVGAQDAVTDDMVQALEEMVQAAKANRLKARSALALAAAAW